MGSFGAGLASVGGSIAQAQELQRKEKMEQVKLALDQARVETEQGQADIARQYAGIAGVREKREQAQFEEQKRLAKLPKFVGFRSVGGRLYYGLQNTDGTVSTNEVTGVDAGQDAQALETSILALPPEAQNAARAAIVPYLQGGDYQGARGALKPILQKYAESQFPGQITVSDTTQTNVIETPQGPALVKTPKHTVTRKLPAGSAKGGGGGGGGGAGAVAPSVDKLTDLLKLPKGSTIVGYKPPTRAEITKVIQPVGEADKRYKLMLDAVAHPNPQNDVALTFNHIGMTLSAQRGARITNAEIERAILSRSLPEDLQALWERISSGQFLTPPERQNMLSLATVNRTLIWQEAWEQAKAEKMANYMPRTLTGLQPVPGIHYVGEDVNVKGQGRSRVTEVHHDGTIEVKPY